MKYCLKEWMHPLSETDLRSKSRLANP